MSAPEAKGLFQKGIIQSGATETMGVRFNTQEASTALAENILKNLNITAGNIQDIQTVSVDDLAQAAAQGLQQTGEQLQILTWTGDSYAVDWEPYIDGTFLPTNPVTDDGFADAGKDVALLIGSNLNEWTSFLPSDPIPVTDELTAALQSAYPDKTDLTAENVDTSLIRLPLLKSCPTKPTRTARRCTPMCSLTATPIMEQRSRLCLTTRTKQAAKQVPPTK